jgi:hypothetical protein
MRMRNDRLVLDTHEWKAYVEGAGISAKVVKRIDLARESGSLFVAAMSVSEIAMLAADQVERPDAPMGSRCRPSERRRRASARARDRRRQHGARRLPRRSRGPHDRCDGEAPYGGARHEGL